jgi:arylsulfatase A-like enzyme
MSTSMPQVQRVVVVVLDGLRPDAIEAFGLEHLRALTARSAHTMAGRTVAPSVTACAMTSLLTGAAPERHGMRSDTFRVPNPSGPLDPIPQVLAQHGISSAAHMAQLPWLFRGLGRKIVRMLGVATAGFHGRGCADILAGALPALRARTHGFTLLHWPDADRAGHAHAWMSRRYGEAARRMDGALAALTEALDVPGDPSTLLIALADHGGGGVNPKHHDSAHPVDRTIPMLFAGGAVAPGLLPQGVSLLDVPPTVLWALGVPIPASYAGRPVTTVSQAALVAA